MDDAESLRGRAVRLLAIANTLRKRGNEQHRDLLMAKAKVLLDEADLTETPAFRCQQSDKNAED